MNALPEAPLPPAPKAPTEAVPEGACDAHVHLLGGSGEYPLYDGRIEDPASGETLDSYLDRFRAHLAALGMRRTVVVQSIFYGTDNTVTAEAVRRLGPEARGIGLVPDGAGDAALDLLVAQNLRGVRLNYVHGGVLSWAGVKAMAPRLAERGLHIQMLMNAHRHMAELAPDIAALPVPVVFDHIGWPDLAAGIGEPGFQTLLRLVGEGQAYVKLSGLYRLCDAPYDTADTHVAALVAANPERCLWGSDWPHIMLNGAGMPRAAVLLDAFHRVVTDADTRRRILVDTPVRLYFA